MPSVPGGLYDTGGQSMPKAQSPIPADVLAAYAALVATLPQVERKGAAMPYTSINGHMFSFLGEEGRLALRLPSDERAAFLKKHKAKLCEQHGRVLEEYVEVPGALLKKTATMKPYFDSSYKYVAALKPKSTTRKK
jgi:hypothetical protein